MPDPYILAAQEGAALKDVGVRGDRQKPNPAEKKNEKELAAPEKEPETPYPIPDRLEDLEIQIEALRKMLKDPKIDWEKLYGGESRYSKEYEFREALTQREWLQGVLKDTSPFGLLTRAVIEDNPEDVTRALQKVKDSTPAQKLLDKLNTPVLENAGNLITLALEEGLGERNTIAIIRELRRNGVHPDPMIVGDDRNLIAAVREQKSKDLIEALIEAPSDESLPQGDINVRDNEGDTALHMACVFDEEEIVKLLLEHKADPTLRDDEGKSSLDEAADNDISAPTLARMMRTGANPYQPAPDLSQPNGLGKSTWDHIVRNDNKEDTERLAKATLEVYGNLNGYNRYGETPLAAAALKGNTIAVETLLEMGAHPDFPNGNGHTTLQKLILALMNRSDVNEAWIDIRNCMLLLLDKGGYIHTTIEIEKIEADGIVFKEHATLLDIAVEKAWVNTTKELQARGMKGSQGTMEKIEKLAQLQSLLEPLGKDPKYRQACYDIETRFLKEGLTEALEEHIKEVLEKLEKKSSKDSENPESQPPFLSLSPSPTPNHAASPATKTF